MARLHRGMSFGVAAPRRRRVTQRLVPPLIGALALVVCGSCASVQRNVDWTGHKIDEVIKENGAPASVQDSTDGAKLYVWEFRHSYPFSRWSTGADGQQHVETTTVNKTTRKTFLVRADGTIVSFTVTDT